MDFLLTLSSWIKPYNQDISLAIVATLLVIFGNSINRAVRRSVRNYWIIVRVTAFIALCTFGYGAITVWVVPLLAKALLWLPAAYYGACIVAGFIVLGLMAERYQRHG